MMNDVLDPLDPASVEWSRRQFALIADGGVWAVPRSGMLFQRRGQQLVLTVAMPWMPEMEGAITVAELREQQDSEFEGIRKAFGAAGIEVIRSEGETT